MLREKCYTECVLFCLLSQCRHLYSENINAAPIFIGRIYVRCSQVIWSPAGSCKEYCISLDHLYIFNALQVLYKNRYGTIRCLHSKLQNTQILFSVIVDWLVTLFSLPARCSRPNGIACMLPPVYSLRMLPHRM